MSSKIVEEFTWLNENSLTFVKEAKKKRNNNNRKEQKKIMIKGEKFKGQLYKNVLMVSRTYIDLKCL